MWVHEGILRRVFANLVSNLVQHGGWDRMTLIWRVASLEDGRVCFQLEDNGKRVLGEVLPDLFQRFYTVDRLEGAQGFRLFGTGPAPFDYRTARGVITVFPSSTRGLGITFTLPAVRNS